MAEVIFYLIREYQKVLPIYVGKINFQGTLFMKWQFLIQVTGRKWKKFPSISWKLWRHNLIWFDMFFWRKNACILLTVRHFSEIRSLCLKKSSCKKKTSNFLTNGFSDLRPSREKHKTMWVIIPIPKIWVWLGHFIKHKPPILEQYFLKEISFWNRNQL